jgi:hypothetical protein
MKARNKLLACATALMVPLCTWAQTEIEPNNGSSSATPVTYNTAMTGSTGTCSPTDNSTDYFSLAVTTQGQLRVQSTMSNTGPVDLEVTFRVRQASTSFLADFALTAGANGVPVNDSFTFPCHGGTGTYFIEVLNPSTSFCTNYTFTYDFIAPVFSNDPEPNNGSSTAVTVPVSIQQTGQIDFFYGDNADYYRLDLPTHGVLNIQWEAEHVGPNTSGTVAVTLRQSSTSVITTWDLPIGANSVPSLQTVSIDCRSNSGFYYLSLASNTCGTSYRFSYTVTPPLFANDAEPNDGSSTAITLAANTQTQGQINFSSYTENSDYYRLDLPTQGILNIHWEAENAGPSSAGTVAATLRQSSTSAITTWNLPVGANSLAASQTVSIDCRSNTGFYYLSLASNICGVSYRFSYTVTPPIFNNDVEPNNGSGSATAIPHSTPTQGQINFSTYNENADYYRLDLPTSGILNIHWQAEHTSATPGSATLTLRQTSTSVLQTWTVPVGASSIPVSETVSIDCRGNQNFYYLTVTGVSCGISYQLSYTVTPPIYDIDPATGTGSGSATTIDLEAATVEGQIGFYYGQASAYYRIVHTGGPIVLTVLAEHAGAAAADYNIRLRAASTSVLQTETRSAGGLSTPLSATVDFGTRAAAVYFIEVYDTPCGMSYAIQCNDADGDGVCNTGDLCANTPPGEGVNTNGCSCSQVTVDDGDVCTLDACLNGNVTNTFQDADGDLTCDANDGCPNDVNKIAAGQCGCGVADTDTDGDLTADCNDGCPSDPNKIDPGVCGCGTADTDSDGDLTADCNDGCPNDPDKQAPGNCGCGNPEPGTTCDDGNSATINDVIGNDCQCAGTLLGNDCEGVPGGPAVPGTACNDNNACTTGDVYDINCQCTGTFADADNDGTCDADDLCPAGPEPGTTCDDGNSATINDVIGNDCQCAGTLLGNDCEGVPGGPAVPGTACNDNNACTTGDVYDINCQCTGTFADADNDGTCDADDLCPAGPEPGTTCDDGNSATINDVIGNDCQCAGTLLGNDCEGVPGGPAVPGSACNDNDACTTGDVYDANCNCTGTFADADNDGTCDANDLCPAGPEPGTTCDDGNANTNNDMVDANCNCAGTPISGCPEETLVLSITLDDDGWQNIWILTKANGLPVAAGGPYASGMAGTVVTEQLCVPAGCYKLYVKDWGFNGIQNGGYVLSDGNGHRIIDADGQFGFVSYMGGKFCLPVGEPELLPSSCDLEGFDGSTAVQCTPVAGASSYEFWFFDPHSNYERHFLRSQPALGPYPNANIPSGLDLNVRARALVGGNYTPYGPACRFSTADAPAMQLTGTDDLRMLSGELSAWPNPNNGDRLNISLTGLNANSATVDITLYDAMGRTVIATTVPAAGGAMNTVLDLTDTVDGVYLLRANANGQVKEQRILVVK